MRAADWHDCLWVEVNDYPPAQPVTATDYVANTAHVHADQQPQRACFGW